VQANKTHVSDPGMSVNTIPELRTGISPKRCKRMQCEPRCNFKATNKATNKTANTTLAALTI